MKEKFDRIILLIEKYTTIIILIAVVAMFVMNVINCIGYEMNHAYTSDAPMYWAVGRGILNGIKPYTGMYENKPIGIFAISALSFYLIDDTLICNLFSLINIFIIGITPLLCIIKFMRKNKDNRIVMNLIAITFAITTGGALMVFAEALSGAFQVEALGCGAICIYLISIYYLDDSKGVLYSILTVIASVSFACGALLKEPFVVIGIAVGLIFSESFNDVVKKVIAPGIYAFLIVVLTYVFTGNFKGYINSYLGYTLKQKGVGGEGFLLKGFECESIIRELLKFSPVFLITIIVVLLISLLAIPKGKKSDTGMYEFFHIARFLCVIFLTILSINISNIIYDHHNALAVPVLAGFCIYSIERLYEVKEKEIACLYIILLIPQMVLLFSNANKEFFGDYSERYKSISEKALYVDRLLNHYGENSYQFLGFNGEKEFYGLTEHSPKGPYFCQDWYNFTEPNDMLDKLEEQVNESNIIIFEIYSSPAVESRIAPIINRDFTTVTNDDYNLKAPSDFNYIIYYRKSVYG